MVTEQQTPEVVTEAPAEGGEFPVDVEPQVSQEAPEQPTPETPAPQEAPPSAEPQADVVPPAETPAPEVAQTPPAVDPIRQELDVLRTRVAEQRRQIREVEAARQIEQSRQAIEAQVQAYSRAEQERLERLNVDPTEAAQHVARGAGERRQQLQNEVHQRQAAVHFVESRQESARTKLDAWIVDRAKDLGLDQETQQSIQALIPSDLVSTETLIDPAKELGEDQRFRQVAWGVHKQLEKLGQAAKATQAATAARQASVGPQHLETPGGAGVETDDAFLARYAAGDSDDTARALAIHRKRGDSPV